MDVAISGKPNTKRKILVEPRDVANKASTDNSLNNMAVPQYMKDLTQGADASAQPTTPQPTAATSKPPSSSESKALQRPTLEPTLPVPAPVTVTVTQSVKASQVTVTITASSAIAPTPATGSIEGFSGTASALPVATSGTNSTNPAPVVRCNSCKVHKRSRIFDSAHKHRGL